MSQNGGCWGWLWPRRAELRAEHLQALEVELPDVRGVRREGAAPEAFHHGEGVLVAAGLNGRLRGQVARQMAQGLDRGADVLREVGRCRAVPVQPGRGPGYLFQVHAHASIHLDHRGRVEALEAALPGLKGCDEEPGKHGGQVSVTRTPSIALRNTENIRTYTT